MSAVNKDPYHMKTIAIPAFVLLAVLLSGCGGSKDKKDDDFFTSGNREADQRAEQQVAKVEQLRGGEDQSAEAGKQTTLFERIGGDAGVKAIVDDFVPRVLADPRVNWERKGIRAGGVLGVGDRAVEWQPSQQNIDRLKKHLGQFLTLATGGPPRYEGRDMRAVHADMKITNVEFDAVMGDLKATLDHLGVATDEQKELLAVIETTRQQVATQR
jgi:hemoglobin